MTAVPYVGHVKRSPDSLLPFESRDKKKSVEFLEVCPLPVYKYTGQRSRRILQSSNTFIVINYFFFMKHYDENTTANLQFVGLFLV